MNKLTEENYIDLIRQLDTYNKILLELQPITKERDKDSLSIIKRIIKENEVLRDSIPRCSNCGTIINLPICEKCRGE